jgi:2-polyprenyl-6-methoxyphenol hydroxylase-like FAD-dependent oxidoreductase
MTTSVLIVGAGPTGLVLGIWLKKQGIDIRIVDKNEGLATTSRATVVHARTLELYRHLGLTDNIIEGGQRAEAMSFWLGGRLRARLKIGAIGRGLTAYPYIYFYPQDRHEKVLTEVAQELGIIIERKTELIAFHDHGNHVTATLRNRDGLQSTTTASYIIGCDGSHSAVRGAMGVDFSGSQYHGLFYVADIEGHGTALNGEAHGVLDDSDGFLIFPYAREGYCRVVGMLRGEIIQRADSLTFNDVSHRVLEQVQLEVEKVRQQLRI